MECRSSRSSDTAKRRSSSSTPIALCKRPSTRTIGTRRRRLVLWSTCMSLGANPRGPKNGEIVSANGPDQKWLPPFQPHPEKPRKRPNSDTFHDYMDSLQCPHIDEGHPAFRQSQERMRRRPEQIVEVTEELPWLEFLDFAASPRSASPVFATSSCRCPNPSFSESRSLRPLGGFRR
jgi:hypothetical protein